MLQYTDHSKPDRLTEK